jgi:hypothetical protein
VSASSRWPRSAKEDQLVGTRLGEPISTMAYQVYFGSLASTRIAGATTSNKGATHGADSHH